VRNPIELLTERRGLRWISSVWVIIALLILTLVTGPRAALPGTFIAPHGVALEMTGTADGALGVLRALDDGGQLANAQRAIYWDFPFIFSYSFGVALLLNRLARYRPRSSQSLIAYAMWGALLAGACDVLENDAMLVLIGRYPDHAYFGLIALVGTVFSLTKWTLFFAAAGYTAVQIIVILDDWAAREVEVLIGLFDRPPKPGTAGKASGDEDVEPGRI
jgi:hypothetical protein